MPPKEIHDFQCYVVYEDGREEPIIIKELQDLELTEITQKLETYNFVRVVRCKDCAKHNVHSGYKEDCCPMFEFRGISYGHEHDYQYCSFGKRKEN